MGVEIMVRCLKYCVELSLQVLFAAPSGGTGKIHWWNPKRVDPTTPWLCTGRLLWLLLPMGRRSRVRRRWTALTANAHRTTEVPLIGLTLGRIRPPHSSLLHTHVLPLNPRSRSPPFTHYLQWDSSHSAKDALLYVYIPLSLQRTS